MDKELAGQLKSTLLHYKSKRILLDTLVQAVPGHTDYNTFAQAILILEAEGVLKRIKSSGENRKRISLGNAYTIHQSSLSAPHHGRLHKKQLELHPYISLENYFALKPETFQKDLYYIDPINAYLKAKGLPKEQLTLPKLSYNLVQDEKWLGEKGGITLLKRIKLWQYLQPAVYFEPITFAINPRLLQEPIHYHLIVENKTPFIQLLDSLSASPFSSLIYGAGWQIVSSIHQFKRQIGTKAQDQFYYFGDLDHEGLHIWYSLKELVATSLAAPFYQKLLDLPYSKGKETQKVHEASLEAFLAHFEEEEQLKIRALLQNKGYYPQETLDFETLSTLIKTYPLTNKTDNQEAEK